MPGKFLEVRVHLGPKIALKTIRESGPDLNQGFPDENVSLANGMRPHRVGTQRFLEWHLTEPGADKVKGVT